MIRKTSFSLTLLLTASVAAESAYSQRAPLRKARSAPHASQGFAVSSNQPTAQRSNISLSGHTGMGNFEGMYAGIYGAAMGIDLNPRLTGIAGLAIIDFLRGSGYSVTGLELSAGGRYKLSSAAPVIPYLLGGLSVLTVTSRVTGFGSRSKTWVGVHGGVGAAIPVTVTTVATAEASFNKNTEYGRLDLVFGMSKRL